MLETNDVDSAELVEYERHLSRREFVAQNTNVIVGMVFVTLAAVAIWIMVA